MIPCNAKFKLLRNRVARYLSCGTLGGDEPQINFFLFLKNLRKVDCQDLTKANEKPFPNRKCRIVCRLGNGQSLGSMNGSTRTAEPADKSHWQGDDAADWRGDGLGFGNRSKDG